nr:CRE-FLP-7 protein [Haemonchus contortus]
MTTFSSYGFQVQPVRMPMVQAALLLITMCVVIISTSGSLASGHYDFADSTLTEGKRTPMVRSSMVRFGKRAPMDRSAMVRFGRAPMDRSAMVRFGKRAPMDRSSMVRFGKRAPMDRSSMVRFGKRMASGEHTIHKTTHQFVVPRYMVD